MAFLPSIFGYSLIDLINNRDTDQALERIKNGQELDSRTWSDHLTPLHIAVSTEQQKIVAALVAAGAPVNAKSYSDWITPLHQAALSGNVVAATIIAPLADLNAKTYREQNTALHIAVKRGDVRMAELLLNTGASAALKNAAGETALHLAARLKDPAMLRIVLASKPDLEAVNNDGVTALYLTVGNAETRKMLIEAGADMDKVFNRVEALQNQVDALATQNARLQHELHTTQALLNIANGKLKNTKTINSNMTYTYNYAVEQELRAELAKMTEDRDWWRTQTRLALESADTVEYAIPVAIPVAEEVEIVEAIPVETYYPRP